MPISEFTRLINYVISVLREERCLKRGVIEYSLPLGDNQLSEPDFLGFLQGHEPMQIHHYLLLEIKALRTGKTDQKQITRARRQYAKFRQIRGENMHGTIMPRYPDAPVLITYVFFQTERSIIENFSNDVDLDGRTGILYYQVPQREIEAIRAIERSENALVHTRIHQIFINHSSELNHWQTRLVPFTFPDLEPIMGLGGGPGHVNVGFKVPTQVLLSQLCVMIIQRKNLGQSTTFTAADFLDFNLASVQNLFVFGTEKKDAITKRLRMFLGFLAEIVKEENFTLIDQEGSKFRIKIKRTSNLHERIQEIQAKLQRRLRAEIEQKKLTDFF